MRTKEKLSNKIQIPEILLKYSNEVFVFQYFPHLVLSCYSRGFSVSPQLLSLILYLSPLCDGSAHSEQINQEDW